MSWLFSQALVEAYSEATFLDGEPCAQLNAMPTPQPFWRNDKTMDASRFSRFGVTSRLLTADRGEELLTWFRGVFLARTFPQQERARELRAHDQDCGVRWPASLARYDPDSCSWKTPQYSLLGDSEEFSETWPRWGTMRNGECWERTTLAPHTSGIESGLWGTPRVGMARGGDFWYDRGKGNLEEQVGAAEAKKAAQMWRTPSAREPGVAADRLVPIEGGEPGGMNRHFDKHTGRMAQIGLEQQVKLRQMWPTPRARDGDKGSRTVEGAEKELNRGRNKDLGMMVQMWPTPCARDHHPNGMAPGSKTDLGNAVKMFPTPTANEDAAGRPGSKMQKMLGNHPAVRGDCSGGSLNPTWVELLMGWPKGWTSLDPMSREEFNEWAKGFAHEKEIIQTEVMPDVRKADGEEEVCLWEAGGRDGVPEAETLQPFLREYKDGDHQVGMALEGEEVPESQLRVLWDFDSPTSPPHGRELEERPPRQLADSMRLVPSFPASYGPEAWQNGTWEIATDRVVKSCPHRVDRLRALGNGQVPAVVALAWEILTERSDPTP